MGSVLKDCIVQVYTWHLAANWVGLFKCFWASYKKKNKLPKKISFAFSYIAEYHQLLLFVASVLCFGVKTPQLGCWLGHLPREAPLNSFDVFHWCFPVGFFTSGIPDSSLKDWKCAPVWLTHFRVPGRGALLVPWPSNLCRSPHSLPGTALILLRAVSVTPPSHVV